VKRYDIETEDSGISWKEVESADGEFIKYSDLLELVENIANAHAYMEEICRQRLNH